MSCFFLFRWRINGLAKETPVGQNTYEKIPESGIQVVKYVGVSPGRLIRALGTLQGAYSVGIL
jgi:hypothetical protein